MLRLLRWAATAATLTSSATLVGYSDYSDSVSAYCDVGTMADGDWTYRGAAASDVLPFGTQVWVEGYGAVTVEDRGRPGLFYLDLAMPGDCDAAWDWGRRWPRTEVLRWGW